MGMNWLEHVDPGLSLAARLGLAPSPTTPSAPHVCSPSSSSGREAGWRSSRRALSKVWVWPNDGRACIEGSASLSWHTHASWHHGTRGRSFVLSGHAPMGAAPEGGLAGGLSLGGNLGGLGVRLGCGGSLWIQVELHFRALQWWSVAVEDINACDVAQYPWPQRSRACWRNCGHHRLLDAAAHAAGRSACKTSNGF